MKWVYVSQNSTIYVFLGGGDVWLHLRVSTFLAMSQRTFLQAAEKTKISAGSNISYFKISLWNKFPWALFYADMILHLFIQYLAPFGASDGLAFIFLFIREQYMLLPLERKIKTFHDHVEYPRQVFNWKIIQKTPNNTHTYSGMQKIGTLGHNLFHWVEDEPWTDLQRSNIEGWNCLSNILSMINMLYMVRKESHQMWDLSLNELN